MKSVDFTNLMVPFEMRVFAYEKDWRKTVPASHAFDTVVPLVLPFALERELDET